MATIIPTLATNLKELNDNILNDSSAIVVTNKNLFSAIRKQIKSETSRKKKNRGLKILGTGIFVAGLVNPITGPITLAATLVEIAAGVGIFKSGLNSKLTKKSVLYNISLETDEILLLLKVEGDNYFNYDSDVLDLKTFLDSLNNGDGGAINEDSIK